MTSQKSKHNWRYDRELNEFQNAHDFRSEAQIDRDRLLYSTAVARLAEVTQVISADHGYVFHNRLTHSLKVAQLARRISENLIEKHWNDVEAAGGLDADAAEAAGLAHDLGHPPFGHIAEDELDKAIKRIDISDGYEGNAQTFRLVSRLMVGDPISANNDPIAPGLNLTRATLNGVLKYPWMINGNPHKTNKWGAYETEKELFDWVRTEFDKAFSSKHKSLEAEVMDWADDITYAVHDVVDFYIAGRIPLEEFGKTDNKRILKSFFEEVFNRPGNEAMKSKRAALEKEFEFVCKNYFVGIEDRYSGSIEQRKTVWQMMTALIGEYVHSFKIAPSSESLVEIEKKAENQIAMLKQLTWHFVILNHELATVQFGQRHIIKTVFELLYQASPKNLASKLIPPFFEELLSNADERNRIRLIADYVSSMTETEVITIFRKLTGQHAGPVY